MPTRPPTFRPAHQPTAKDYDQQRDTFGCHKWYKLPAWTKRSKRQRKLHPLCAECLREGRAVEAYAADHVVPHRGDWELFINGELQSLCATHHSQKTRRGE